MQALTRARRLGWSVALAALVVAVLTLGTVQVASAQGGTPVNLTFDKADPDGDGIWTGALAGDWQGTVEVSLVVLDQSTDVWLVQISYNLTAEGETHTVMVAGTLDTATGVVTGNGAVTQGPFMGAPATVQAQNVDAESSRFKGVIRILPGG